MLEQPKRQVAFYTPNKLYRGKIDIQNGDMRTLDLLNSSAIYWKNPKNKSFTDSIMLYDAIVELQGNIKLSEFDMLQLRMADIIFFSDSLGTTGSATEKIRAEVLSKKSSEKESRVKIITRMRGDAFYMIVGTFFGLFRNKSQQRFLPIMKPKVREIVRTGADWQKKEIEVSNSFIGLSTVHIEACSMDYE